ncbi:GPCR fungal pheromone mating factor [Polychytrium aggregatum]|uniref:GPCR fungal pheromone mating factor n=1 Tax=Polychytrium aggregatum TaxID=110093 RepID=UPI0022FDE8B5|nr:GPCR fungal pheromone mating factor [Polychytrium aggregatum]KAI9207884.1 GPCR fungal pheromone mating factor [Polychytrium aggregatum]
MSPQNIALAVIAVLASFLVFYIHYPSRNLALLMLASITGLLSLLLVIGAAVFPSSMTVAASFPPWSALQIFCEIQAFLLNVLGISIYGSCLCLSIELNLRTSAKRVLRSDDSDTRPKLFLYLVLSLGVPVVFIVAVLWLRSKPAYYIPQAFCDNQAGKYIFLIVFVISLIIYTIMGSIFTMIAIRNYIRKRSEILQSLNDGVGSSESYDFQRQQAQSSRTALLQILHRMVVWSAGYHLLAIVYVIQTTYAAVSNLITNDPNYEPMDSVNNESAFDRALTVMYATSALSILLLACFGSGKSAIERYRTLICFGPRTVRRAVKARGHALRHLGQSQGQDAGRSAAPSEYI